MYHATRPGQKLSLELMHTRAAHCRMVPSEPQLSLVDGAVHGASSLYRHRRDLELTKWPRHRLCMIVKVVTFEEGIGHRS